MLVGNLSSCCNLSLRASSAKSVGPFLYHSDPFVAFPLHTDGAFLENAPDWIGLCKLNEQDARGGETTLLNIQSWLKNDSFLDVGALREKFPWFLPSSNPSVVEAALTVRAPILTNFGSSLGVRFGLLDPQKYQKMPRERELHDALTKSFHASSHCLDVNIPLGAMLCVNNKVFLHGRKHFSPNEKLQRTVIRLQGFFS